jgi:hypothetical protein
LVGCKVGWTVGCPVGYEEGEIPQELFSVVGHVDTHCCKSASRNSFRRTQLACEVQVLYVAINCHLLHDSHLDDPGPEKSPLAHFVHVLAPALL